LFGFRVKGTLRAAQRAAITTDEHGLVDRLVPPCTVKGAAYLVDVERWGDDRGVLEGGHQRDVQFVQRARREPEQVPVDPSPRPLRTSCGPP
jgi:hypothetical protein